VSWSPELSDFLTNELPAFWPGLVMTLQLLVVSTALSFVGAILLGLARVSTVPVVSYPAFLYSACFRGTPLLVQIFLIYYGVAQFHAVRHSFIWPILRESFPCALIALTLNMVAYLGEVGMGPVLLYRRIILPRALRLMLPAMCNEVLIQLKSTSLASTITLLDVTGVGRRFAAASYSTTPLLVAGGIYVVLTFCIIQLFRLLEHRLNRFQRH
jgi:His/Glu/Gln/Arg/opine family amino acid ABC transporter permease subunit